MRNLLIVILLSSIVTHAKAEPKKVHVRGERLTLGAIAPRVAPELQALDLGPTPEPGNSRIVTRDEVLRIARQALVTVPPTALPHRIVIERLAQRIGAPEIQKLITTELAASLPKGVRCLNVRVADGAVVDLGDVSVSIGDTPWRAGRQSVGIELHVEGLLARRFVATVELADTRRQVNVINRGDKVRLRVIGPNLLMETTAIAQQNGSQGGSILVLPMLGRKEVIGTVIETGVVEVTL